MQTRERAHCARSVFPFIKKKKKTVGCSQDNTCSVCEQWDGNQWSKYFNWQQKKKKRGKERNKSTSLGTSSCSFSVDS